MLLALFETDRANPTVVILTHKRSTDWMKNSASAKSASVNIR
ncbi:hypothetical protein [Pseudothermotoga sp.]|nr:hypothetical protein [Pseudothermotoga sp.]MDW8140217.1 hypothetical protein [Pseudothermotoga sp.]